MTWYPDVFYSYGDIVYVGFARHKCITEKGQLVDFSYNNYPPESYFHWQKI